MHVYFSNYVPYNITKCIFCPLCKLNTVKDIWLKLHTLLKHNETKCHAQEPCLNGHSCIDTYSYSCFNPCSNERKSMFKSGDSHAVWTWIYAHSSFSSLVQSLLPRDTLLRTYWTWKYFKWAQVTCMALFTESVVDKTDHFAGVFVRENVAYDYDVVTTLWRSKA